ncbi:flagellar hook-length control protein FliK [Roseococcus sp.]|uniref:flagellar hook-length control protein FliK n=1 Tax=Roseococcus sp. TaxID=2109646 RepID=UPI003BABCB0E
MEATPITAPLATSAVTKAGAAPEEAEGEGGFAAALIRSLATVKEPGPVSELPTATVAPIVTPIPAPAPPVQEAIVVPASIATQAAPTSGETSADGPETEEEPTTGKEPAEAASEAPVPSPLPPPNAPAPHPGKAQARATSASAEEERDQIGPVPPQLPSPEASIMLQPSARLAVPITGGAPESERPSPPASPTGSMARPGPPLPPTAEPMPGATPPDSTILPKAEAHDARVGERQAPPPAIAADVPLQAAALQAPQRLVVAVGPAPAAAMPSPVRQVSTVAVALAFAPGGSNGFRLSLEPVDLGRVDIHVQRDGDSHSVRVTAERPETLALLQRDRQELDRGLAEAGLRVDPGGIEFSLGGGADDGFGPGGGGDQRGASRGSPGGPAGFPVVKREAPPPRLSRSLLDLHI